MHKIINKDSMIEKSVNSRESRWLERRRIGFFISNKFRKETGRMYLGHIWLVLDPLIHALLYLFVLTVIKARIEPDSIFIGVTLYRVLQTSFSYGVRALAEDNGGIMCERVASRVLMKASILHLILSTFLQTICTSLLLVYGLGAAPLGGLIYLLASQLLGIFSFGVGLMISPLTMRIPDLNSMTRYTLRLGFFVSPTMYPMTKMEGLHYRFNEFNPFAYFAEAIRYYSGSPSTYSQLDFTIFAVLATVLTIVTVIAISKYDSRRWRLTTWS